MPALTCENCGSITNTTVSEFDFGKFSFDIPELENKAIKCYGKWKDGKWSKGCAYDDADNFCKSFVNSLIKDNK